MKKHVGKVAVLGSGVMGSAIAAHFANAGIRSLVLDVVPGETTPAERAAGLGLQDRQVRDRLARNAVDALLRTRPAPLFLPSRLALIETGNLEDDLHRVSEADWVIEAVREEMSIKKRVLSAAARHMRPDAVLSSNTSGLCLTEMAQALPEGLRPRFLGTHFFNPPRYMKLIEVIPTPHTSIQVLEQVREFAASRLGKGVVQAKDTVNFIANRIGSHAIMVALRVMRELGLTVEEVDALSGPAMARPKTATFRLADLVGLDTLLLVARNVHDVAVRDESRELFVAPDFLRRMVDRGLLGQKSGAGFYKKSSAPDGGFLTLDFETLDYRPALEPNLPELKAIATLDDPAERLRRLVGGDSRGSLAAWRILAATLSYSAMRLGEIADDADTVDRAMKLGFNWELGPFETWDVLGFRPATERLRADGYPLPPWVDALYREGATSLYRKRERALHGPTAAPGVLVPVTRDPRHIDFDPLREAGLELQRNASASLLDLGEGVLGLEFHSKMNAIDPETIEMMLEAAAEAEANWQGLVVANYGVNFCAGANLKLVLQSSREGNWEAIDRVVRSFQEAMNRLERCAVPVVVAPHGLALGGGCEVVLAGHAVRAAAETYMGLVEAGAGLIPAGGGCLRLYRRHVGSLPDPSDAYPALKKSFETIGQAKVSTSAEEARELGFLGPQDGWSMNRDHRVADARAIALALAGSGFSRRSAAATLPVMGRSGMALIESVLVNLLEGRFISEHDRKIGRELARVLCGGDVSGPTLASEQHLLDLERESFLRLCGESKTQDRMLALLTTGKPLRN